MPTHYTADPSNLPPRCPVCGKATFRSEAHARRSGVRILRKHEGYGRPYWSEQCRAWHVTSSVTGNVDKAQRERAPRARRDRRTTRDWLSEAGEVETIVLIVAVLIGGAILLSALEHAPEWWDAFRSWLAAKAGESLGS